MNILVVTVNFGDAKSTSNLVSSIENCKHANHQVKVFIADNKTTNSSKEALERIKNDSKLEIKIFPFKKNYYYWPAASKIISNSFVKKNYPDRIIVCNNDIIIKDKNFFINLSKYSSIDYPIIGPSITNQNNKELNPFMINQISKFKIGYWNIYYSSFLISIFFNHLNKIKNLFKKNKIESENKDVYAVHGAAIIFSDFFFKKGGYLESGFRMYGEELTTAEIARKIGCKISFLADLRIFHNEHTSIAKVNKKKLFKIGKESHNFFLNNYMGKNIFLFLITNLSNFF